MTYTPQIIANGGRDAMGTKPMDVAKLLNDHFKTDFPAVVTVSQNGDRLNVSVQALDGRLPDGRLFDVLAVSFLPEQEVEILRGENAGRRVRYVNTVVDIASMGQWDGHAPGQFVSDIGGDLPKVILVQEVGTGPIVGAFLMN